MLRNQKNQNVTNRNLSKKKRNIWKDHTSLDFLSQRGLNYEEGDIGPGYGFQWRHLGAQYISKDNSYDGQGIDQLKNVNKNTIFFQADKIRPVICNAVC